MKSFENLSDFNEAQTQEFNQIANNFHFWHRRSELPLYAAVLNDIQASIRARTETSQQEVTEWLKRSETFTQSFRACHPINFSNNIIRTLSDTQLHVIKKKRNTRHAAFKQRYYNETRDERLQRRSKSILKWISRTGLQLNNSQKKLLRETMAKQISLRPQYFALYADWNRRLYQILDNRQSEDLDVKMAAHLDELWHLLERAHPKEWRANRELWSEFVFKLIRSLNREQRAYATDWIKKMGKTLLHVSKRGALKPTFSSSMGCAMDPLTATN